VIDTPNFYDGVGKKNSKSKIDPSIRNKSSTALFAVNFCRLILYTLISELRVLLGYHAFIPLNPYQYLKTKLSSQCMRHKDVLLCNQVFASQKTGRNNSRPPCETQISKAKL